MAEPLSQLLARVFSTPAADFTDDAGPHSIPKWDSAGHLRMVLELEKTYGVKFTDDEVIELIAVDAIAAALQAKGVALE